MLLVTTLYVIKLLVVLLVFQDVFLQFKKIFIALSTKIFIGLSTNLHKQCLVRNVSYVSGSFSNDSEMLVMVICLVSERLWSEPIHYMLV